MPDKIRLQQTFAAGEGNAALTAVEVPVLQYRLQQRFGGLGGSHKLQRPGEALTCAFFGA